MSKQHFSLLAFATLLCMMLFGTVSCKKDDINAKDFFIDVDFLPESETNGKVAPRLMANFNDEMVMIEIRPSADSLVETILFLCQDHEAYMMCGNENLMVFAPYDMETDTPSRDMLLVTHMDDNALVLTKGFMDWNTNTMATGDMMVLPIDGSKNGSIRGGYKDMRVHFMNHLVKPVTEELERAENFCGFFGKQAKLVFMSLKYIVSTTIPIYLFSDDPELLKEQMEYPIILGTAQGVQAGLIRLLPKNMREAVSRGVAFLSWHLGGGYGKVDDYEEESGGENALMWGNYLCQGYQTTTISTPAVPSPMFVVNLNVGNVTENSAYLKGSYRFGSTSSITPVEMGYIIKISGGSEHTEYDMNFQGITLSGLQKATKYTAFAYVKSVMGDRVLSPGVTFWTLGFEAFPTSLTFPTEGDTKSVALSYSDEDITSWDITSKPSWCIITKNGDKMFDVKVGKSTEARSGTIIVTAHSNTLGNVTENIEVTQLGANGWDGTSWVFTGTLTTNDFEGHSSSEETALTLMINSVSNNDIMFSWAQVLSAAANNGYSDHYTIDGNGNLVYSATVGYSGDWGSNDINSQVTFVRTSSTTATANLQYRESFENYVYTISGLLQGSLVNAKEIKDYETTINLKTPIFDNKALKNK